MNQAFTEGVSQKTLEIFRKTGLSKTQFCKRVDIPISYLSNLESEKAWPKIPAWAWFFFQDISNGKVVFNSSGDVVNVSDGYTIEELHEDCKQKAEERALSDREDILDASAMSEEDEIGSMEIDKVPQYSLHKKYAKQEDLERVQGYIIDFLDTLIEARKEEVKKYTQLKQKIIRWQTKAK